jgi:ectoine hydroxylase-related dioxygenase (phytanoyl-CoA dioxygenase family)
MTLGAASSSEFDRISNAWVEDRSRVTTLFAMAEPASNTDREVEDHLGAIAKRGYTVVEDALDPNLVDQLSEAIDRIEREFNITPAKNEFEGRDTYRVYNLLAHAGVFQQVPVHPKILPIIEGVLDRGCLVSTLSSISIGPGETPQMIHSDDQVIGLERPHQAVVCNSMWALSDFTEANGATRLVPGSHLLDHAPDFNSEIESIPATMKRGSVLVWHGSLWHGGGANHTRERRVGLAMNYCAGFLRQQENQQLGIPRDVARDFSPRLKRLLGYGVYRSLIGHIEKRDPIELLGDGGDLNVIWDR